MIKDVLAILMVLLPQRWRPVYARRVLGWDIHPSVWIGRSIIRARHVTMEAGAWIGHRNTVRGLDELVLKRGASLGGRNYVWAVPLGSPIFAHRPNRHTALVIGEYGAVTTGHEIDCSDRVEFADYAAMTGYGSQILSHRLDLARDVVTTEPVTVGYRSFVMTGCILLSGTTIPDHSILSAGSVVVTPLSEPYTLYRGNPALAVRALPANLRLFRRQGTQATLPSTLDETDAV